MILIPLKKGVRCESCGSFDLVIIAKITNATTVVNKNTFILQF